MKKGQMYMFKTIFELGMLIVGSALIALGFNGFLISNEILAGGLTGISIFVSHFTGIGIGAIYFLLNVPLFLWGFREMGKRFVVYSGVTVAVLSLMIDASRFYLPSFTHNPLLGGIFGGMLCGIGLILILKAGGSSGGIDIVSVILNRRYGFSIGQIMLAINSIVLVMSLFMYNVEQTMYTLISIYASTFVMETSQGIQRRKSVMIVSSHHEEITSRIWKDLKRGVTYLHGKGAYSQHQKQIIMCVMTRFELNELKQLVLHIDPEAFMTVTTLDEVVGYFRTESKSTFELNMIEKEQKEQKEQLL